MNWNVLFHDEFDTEFEELTADDGREVWRAAFAFDPARDAIVLVAGEKQGRNQGSFYKRLIKIADTRFDSHLRQLKAAKTAKR